MNKDLKKMFVLRHFPDVTTNIKNNYVYIISESYSGKVLGSGSTKESAWKMAYDNVTDLISSSEELK